MSPLPGAPDERVPADPSRWFLSASERGNPHTRVDERFGGDVAWSSDNEVEPLVDGATYFAALLEELRTVGEGDLVLFTDWQGDAGQRLGEGEDTTILDVLGDAQSRGATVRGLVWRSHTNLAGFFHEANRHLGERLRRRGVPVVLDMRVRAGGSHHQKFVVIRRGAEPERDVAFVGGIDLAHNRRDDHLHEGDPQGRGLVPEYGERAAWHDVQVRLRGPVVHDVETVFRERWDDPSPPSSAPWRRLRDKLSDVRSRPDRLPEQLPAPPPAGARPVQLLRTYPALGGGRSLPYAPDGERSVARGYLKALGNARRLIYVEDQYCWHHDGAQALVDALRAHPELRLVVVVPLLPDVGGVNRDAQVLARSRAVEALTRAAPGRVTAYGLENRRSVPVYVHAKVTVVDDRWAAVGSDNFNRRSWTHDAELSAAVVDDDFARGLRLRLAAEHLDRLDAVERDGWHDAMADCLDPHDMADVYAKVADELEAWHRAGRTGPRPAGRLRHLPSPRISPVRRAVAGRLLDLVHDPDGRPRDLRRQGGY
ncbi:phospholipase D family protein [Nocardioides sp. YIM 152588]|uniref:phospholipase D-like domain-containing protein n=1 Tax=Nocardioides sp. YIM 152588 TaxID=3158259 RepID=UPI0032E3CEA8